MTTLLKSLWHDHIQLRSANANDEAKKLFNKMTAADNRLRKELNPDQAALLQSVEDCLDEIEYMECERAFIEGVRFAVKFLCEASD
nr:hypothetical protein [Clostridia bacterium]